MLQQPWSRAILIAVLIIVSATGSQAQEQGRHLTLANAIDIALASNHALQAAQHQVEAASAGIIRARAAFLPKLDVSESFTYADNPVFAFSARLNQGRFRQDDFAVQRLNNPDATRNFKTTLSLAQPLYSGGKASIGLEQARLQRQANAQDFDRQQQEVIFQVVRAYYGVLRAQAEVAVVQAALQAAEANRNLARSRFQAGVIVEADVLSAQVRLASLQEQEIMARQQLAIAKATVNDAMGQPLDEPFVPVDQLTQRPSHHAQIEGLEALALERRPDYQQLATIAQTLRQGVAMARAEYLPTVNVTANYDVNTRNAVSDGQDSWFVTVGLQWNLFNGLADQAKITEAQAHVSRLQATRASMGSRISLEVKTAFFALQAAQQRLAVTAETIVQAQEALRMLRDRYQAGLTTIVTLLTGEAELTRAKGNRTQALYDYNVGLAALELALGTIHKEAF